MASSAGHASQAAGAHLPTGQRAAGCPLQPRGPPKLESVPEGSPSFHGLDPSSPRYLHPQQAGRACTQHSPSLEAGASVLRPTLPAEPAPGVWKQSRLTVVGKHWSCLDACTSSTACIPEALSQRCLGCCGVMGFCCMPALLLHFTAGTEGICESRLPRQPPQVQLSMAAWQEGLQSPQTHHPPGRTRPGSPC